MKKLVIAALGVWAVSLHAQQAPPAPAPQNPDSFRFKSGVELINVTVTVSDASGRFVPNLRKDDFILSEDDQPQTITHFSAERVPVSLGIALDTSGSMEGEKIKAAHGALDRFLFDLLDRQDEIFIYLFSNYPRLLQGWTTDRNLLSRALGRITPNGGTALYDTVEEAIPLTSRGQNVKKALLVISDGNDTASRADIRDVRRDIRESETLVYAIGIDAAAETVRSAPPPRTPFPPIPFPFPPGRGRGRGGWPQYPPPQGPTGGWSRGSGDERVNVAALRDMTDDSGGRTEIIRDPQDLDPATAGIADELSKQYYLGYPAAGKKDGKWHSIRVQVRNGAYRVRARKGYVAS